MNKNIISFPDLSEKNLSPEDETERKIIALIQKHQIRKKETFIRPLAKVFYKIACKIDGRGETYGN